MLLVRMAWLELPAAQGSSTAAVKGPGTAVTPLAAVSKAEGGDAAAVPSAGSGDTPLVTTTPLERSRVHQSATDKSGRHV